MSAGITQYNALATKGATEQQAFSNAVAATNTNFGKYLAGLNGGKASLAGYGASLVGATVKTIGLTAASMALNAAVSMGVSVIITGLISAFTAWINKSEEITQKAQEAADKINSINDSLKTNTETVENAKRRYAELAQEVENLGKTNQSRGSLNNEEYAEFLDLSNQLAGIFPTLTKGYDENGNAILDLSGDVNTIVGSLDDLIKKEQELANQKIMEEFPNVFSGFTQDLKNAKQEVKSAQSEFDKINNAYQDLANGGMTSQAFDTQGNGWFTNANGEKVTVTLAEYISNLEALGIAYEKTNIMVKNQFGGDQLSGYLVEATGDINTAFTSKLETARNNLKYAKQQLEGEASSINQYLNTWLQTEFSYNQIEDAGLQDAIQQTLFNFDWDSLPDNIDKNDWAEVSEYLRKNVLFAINNVQDNPEISKALSDLFTNQELSPEQKNNLIKQIQDYFGKDNPISVFLQPQFEENETTQKNINSAISKFGKDNEGGLKEFFDKNSINTQEEVDKWNEVTKGINNAEDAMNAYAEAGKNLDKMTDSLDSLSSAIKVAESAFELFNEVEKDFNSTGAISSENIQKILNKFPALEDELYEYIMGMRTGTSVMELLKSKSDDMATMSADAFRRMYLSSNSVSKDMKKQFGDTFEAVGLGWDNTQSVMANVNSQIVDANGNVTSTFSEQWANACASAGASVSAFAQGLSTLFSGGIDNIEVKNGVLYSKAADGGTANLVNTSAHKILDDINAKGQGSEYWDTYGSLVSFGADGKIVQTSRDNIWYAIQDRYLDQYNTNVKNQEEFERKQKEFEERMKQYAVTSDDKNSGSDKNEALDNYLKYSENRYKSHQNELRYINDLEWGLNNLAKNEKERLDIAGKTEEAYRDHTKNVIKDLKHEIELENKRNNGETARTIELQKEIQRVAHAEAERLRIKLRALGYLDEEIEKTKEIQELQNEWWSAQESIDNRYNDILDDIQRHADNVADYYDDINEELDERITKEEALLQIMQGQTDATSKLMDVQTEIDKALRDSKLSLQYLDEKERESIFNEEDYKKLSRTIESTQNDIDSLSSRFYNDVIEAYEQDKTYLIESITAEYERQVAMKERELEIAQAQVDLTKKQLQLNNVLAEKNVKQLVERNGQYVWEWVADTDKVRQATEELMDAEAELKEKEYEQKQQEAIDEQQRRIDSIKAEQAANDYRVEKMNEYVDNLSKAIENCVDPIKSFEELAIQLGDAGGDIVAAFQNAINSISGMGVKTSSTSSSSGGARSFRQSDYNAHEAQIATMKSNSAEYNITSSSHRKSELHAQNQQIGASLGLSYDSGSGKWKKPDGTNAYASGTRNTKDGLSIMGEDGFEAFISKNGRLIPISQPTIGNIDSGGVVFNTEQMSNLRSLWDLSNLGKIKADSIISDKTNLLTQNSGTTNTFNGGIVVNAPRDYNDFVKQLTQRVKTKSV